MLRQVAKTAFRCSPQCSVGFSSKAMGGKRPEYTEADVKEALKTEIARVKKVQPAEVATAALFAEAKKAGGDLHGITRSLLHWVKFNNAVQPLVSVIEHPLASKERVVKLTTDLTSHLGMDKLSAATVLKLAEDKKLRVVGDVARAFGKLVTQHNKESVVTVATAEPLTKEQLSKVEAKVKPLVKQGFKLVLVEKINPSLIGGLTIDVDEDVHQDLSLRGAMRDVEAKLARAS